MITRLVFLLILGLAGCANLSPDRTVVLGGVFYAPVHGNDILGGTFATRVDVDINRIAEMTRRYGQLHVGLEGFITDTDRRRGALGGLLPTVRYSYPLTSWLTPYVEGGGGPAWIGFDTHEQGRAGFNFYSHIGAGLEIKGNENISLFTGYRFGHFSHGGLRSSRNRGIEAGTVIFGAALKWP